MIRASFAFALGTLLFHQLPDLPAVGWLLFLLPLLFASLALRRLALAGLIAGFSWSQLHAFMTVPAGLSGDERPLRLVVQGQIVSLVDRSGGNTRFVLAADRVDQPDGPSYGHWRFRLSWRDAPELRPGDTWRLGVRLRAAHGYASPGAWDYEGWLYWQGIGHTGYVDPDVPSHRLDREGCCRLTRWRDFLAESIDAAPASAFARGVMRALTIGDTSALSDEAKALFRATGTSHLMAISGLHIGLIAGLGLTVGAWGWRRLPALCGRVPARIVGALLGFLLALGYAALAGLGLPTQRALIMLAVFAAALVGRRRSRVPYALALAMFLVLAWHPPSILSAGFWLSFGAVLVIVAALAGNRHAPVWKQAVRVQLLLGLALWPVLASFGLGAGTVAPLANLLLVPLFGLVLVPLSLLTVAMLTVVPEAAGWSIAYLGDLFDLVQRVLVWLAAQPFPAAPTPAGGMGASLVLAVAVGLALAPVGMPLRWLAVPLLVAGVLPPAPRVGPGAFELHLLDVGQGLSAVVLTRDHTLVFDTGPAYPSGFSTAEAVVVPFLHHTARRRIDRLVISHGDSDHAGGVGELLEAFEVKSLWSGEPQRVGHDAQPCVAGTAWRWDGVLFEILHPAVPSAFSGNDASCVLRVSNTGGSVLLTGDIEARMERRLAQLSPGALRSDIVVAPHHGSRSSSSAALIDATSATYVLYAAGWANRYGFPAAEVQERWQRAGVQAVNTALAGSVSFEIGTDRDRRHGPTGYRQSHRRFWWHNPGSAPAPHAVSSAD